MRQVKIKSMDFSESWTEYTGSNAWEAAMEALGCNKEYIVGDLDEITVHVKNQDGTVQKFKAKVTFELEPII